MSSSPKHAADPPEHCTYCGGSQLGTAFLHEARRWVRCAACRALLQIPPVRPGEHLDGLAEFIAESDEFTDHAPDRAKWQEFRWYWRGQSLLEIGPGTGHFLAAARDAGFSVSGIEPNPRLRAYIRRRWNIETTAEHLESGALPASSFDNVVSINCIEHIVDPMGHLAAAFRVLKPGGRLLVSTCNADCLVVKMVGRYWSMIKEPTHFCIASPESLRVVGRRAGLAATRVWCSEYPLETPAGLAVALRDWLRDRRGKETNGADGKGRAADEPTEKTVDNVESSASPGTRVIHRLITAQPFGWVAALMAHFMLAGTVKALYEKPRCLVSSPLIRD